MKTVPDGVVDLTVTSPPYDDLRTYTKEAAWNWEKFCEVAKELYRITAEGGVVVWIVNDQTKNGSETGNSFRQALYFKDECGFNLHDTMIYAKQNYPPLTHNRYEQQFEYMFVFSKGKLNKFNPSKEATKTQGGKSGKFYQTKDSKETESAHSKKETGPLKTKPNIWFYTVGGGKEKHPAVFPEALAHDHILSWSNENDLVFDPFHGSGTTGKMCKKLNRKFFGIDIAREYIDIQIERIDCFEKASDHD
jgi:site-specific DNA-methyltransferase (adenine-specific)